MSLDFLYITYKGFVNRTVMEDGRQRFIKSNANTLKAYLMGHFITTMEPQNVKAVLATQFKDFELGEEVGPLEIDLTVPKTDILLNYSEESCLVLLLAKASSS